MRLIDADALKEHVRSFTGMFTDEGFFVSLDAVLNAIDYAFTIDAEPVRHGLWDDNTVPFCNVCSECKAIVDRTSCSQNVVRKGVVLPLMRKLNFCPHCGAKMDTEDINVPTNEPGKICPINGAPCNECVPGAHCAKMDGGAEC